MEESAYHSLYEREMTHWFCTTRRDVIREVLTPFREHPGEVLEIGSGTGGNITLLREYGRLTCVEPSELGRELTARREGEGLTILSGFWPDEVTLAPEQRFDLIALLDVLEHMPNDSESLLAVRERLRPGGVVVITVPSYQWMWSNHDVILHHHRRYSRRRLRSLLASAGLQVDRISYFNSILLPAAIVARFTFRLLRIERSPGRAVPRPVVNSALRRMFSAEVPLLRRLDLPWGLSLIAVCSIPSRE